MMAMIYPRSRSTSPQRRDVDLRSKSGEEPQFHRGIATPHPALRADLSLRERWTFNAAAFRPVSGKF
jgi:hypothetical protein